MYLDDDNKACVRWTIKDTNYTLSKCELELRGSDMHVKLSGCGRKVEFDIENYRSKTALEALEGHGITSGDKYLGRHFEDAVFQAWHDLGLDVGYQLQVLRDMRRTVG